MVALVKNFERGRFAFSERSEARDLHAIANGCGESRKATAGGGCGIILWIEVVVFFVAHAGIRFLKDELSLRR
jgi:hypothetical protein